MYLLSCPVLPVVVIFFVHFHCKELFINAHFTDIDMTACTDTKVSSQSYVTTKPQTRFCICIVIDTNSPNYGSNLFGFKTRENRDRCLDCLVTNAGLLSFQSCTWLLSILANTRLHHCHSQFI